jgi:hypothetical protein
MMEIRPIHAHRWQVWQGYLWRELMTAPGRRKNYRARGPRVLSGRLAAVFSAFPEAGLTPAAVARFIVRVLGPHLPGEQRAALFWPADPYAFDPEADEFTAATPEEQRRITGIVSRVHRTGRIPGEAAALLRRVRERTRKRTLGRVERALADRLRKEAGARHVAPRRSRPQHAPPLDAAHASFYPPPEWWLEYEPDYE